MNKTMNRDRIKVSWEAINGKCIWHVALIRRGKMIWSRPCYSYEESIRIEIEEKGKINA